LTIDPKGRRQFGVDWESLPEELTLGVELVELVSSAMYVEPLTIIREYVQNAADAIDDARGLGLAAGRVDIWLDPSARAIRVRDDGIGLAQDVFVRRLRAFGASEKRRHRRRGFRGVGRLAGLGYCQELIFRSKAEGESIVSELRWDGRLLRSLFGVSSPPELAEAVCKATAHRQSVAPKEGRFFEVELRGIVRHGRDDLLNEVSVSDYLAQVAPVPLAPSFRYAELVTSFLFTKGVGAGVEIYVNGAGPLYRPYRDVIAMKRGVVSKVAAPEFFEIAGVDGSAVACGWVLHHEYLGSIPRAEGVRGLRLRSGNIQVGGDDVLLELFMEPRFNSWVVAEVHILDRRIVPNGRRDYYEQSVHFAHVLNHLAPLARAISSRCRIGSQQRQVMRDLEALEDRIVRDLGIIKQGAITKSAKLARVAEIKAALQRMERIAKASVLSSPEQARVDRRHRALAARLARAAAGKGSSTALARLTPQRRRAYEEVFALIYVCSSDLRVAKDLVQRVLVRLSSLRP
jgi:Histidine kinase-, DNA gyrase B-, and HSP90-like ATPase